MTWRRWCCLALAATAVGCSSGGESGTGALAVVVNGLPAGAAASLVVAGPTGAHIGVGSSTTLGGLAPGDYTVQSNPVVVGTDVYRPRTSLDQVAVRAGATASFTAQYTISPATLKVELAGVPAGALVAVQVSGPGGFAVTVSQPTTLAPIAPGAYTITASPLNYLGVLYLSTPAATTVNVAPGEQAIATLQYSHPESTLSVTIDDVYITQGAQGADFSIPLITDRPGMLRVFLRGSEPNTVSPEVRVRLYAGATLTNTYSVHAINAGVPTAIDEGSSTTSWNLLLPENVIEPGVRILIDVDPAGIVPLATRANLTYPVAGTPQPLNVVAGTPYNLMFVPVMNSVDGQTGDVSVAGIPDFTTSLKLLHPMWAATTGVHAPFTFTGGQFQSNDANSAWLNLLLQIEMLRQVEGGPAYYYGVLHVSYLSGQVGLGYVGARFMTNYRSAVGWDSKASAGQAGTRAGETYAHELGHNLGLQHAPCGGATNPDPAYPYTGGRVGRPGFNVMTGTITPATDFDLMSYCAPTWVSDYSFRRLVEYATSLRSPVPGPPVAQRSILLSGTVLGGRVVLNPAIEVVAPATLPVEAGPYRLEGRSEDGSMAFAIAFAPTVVGDTPLDGAAQFVFTVPLAGGTSLARMRLTGPGVDTTIATIAAPALRVDTTIVTAVRVDPGTVRLTWSAAEFPLLMVRDANTGAVLAFARGGEALVRSAAAPLAVTASNGIRSTQVRVAP